MEVFPFQIVDWLQKIEYFLNVVYILVTFLTNILLPEKKYTNKDMMLEWKKQSGQIVKMPMTLCDTGNYLLGSLNRNTQQSDEGERKPQKRKSSSSKPTHPMMQINIKLHSSSQCVECFLHHSSQYWLHRLPIQLVNIEEPENFQIYHIICDGLNAALGCGRFSEFCLFFTEQVFTLPLYCYEKNNQGTINLHTKHQSEHTPN